MPRWEDALDTQLDLWKWSRTELGRSYYEGWGKSVLENKTGSGFPNLSKSVLTSVPEIIERMVWLADPIYIDPDMMTLAEYAFPSYKPEPLQETDLITQEGFMVLPRPISVPDAFYKQVSTRAICWVRTILRSDKGDKPGIIVAWFSSVDDPDDYWSDLEEISMRRLHAGSNKLILNHLETWSFGTTHQTDDPRAIDRYVQTFFRLMLQTITVKTESEASRGTRRRAKKDDFPDKKITVVTLRRPRADKETDEHKTVEWSHRWIVSGHWRWQPFKNTTNTPCSHCGLTSVTHKQIWIGDYVKGPDDKPLEIRKLRVFELVR